jgi:hypothetical protein
MIMNLLFTVLCFAIAFLVTLDVQAPRRMERVRSARPDDRNRQADLARRE